MQGLILRVSCFLGNKVKERWCKYHCLLLKKKLLENSIFFLCSNKTLLIRTGDRVGLAWGPVFWPLPQAQDPQIQGTQLGKNTKDCNKQSWSRENLAAWFSPLHTEQWAAVAFLLSYRTHDMFQTVFFVFSYIWMQSHLADCRILV